MLKSRLFGAAGIVAVVSGIAGVLAAQTAGSPAFEVASVKPNKSGDKFSRIASPTIGGLFTATNAALSQLIQYAYGVESFQLVSEPSWVGAERFDIAARASEEVIARTANPRERAQVSRMMLRALLEERFKLHAHQETRDHSVYSLVVFAANGTLGPHLKSTAESECSQTPNACPSIQFGFSGVVAHGATLTELVGLLVQIVGSPINDRTGLTGRFDYTLDWTFEPLTASDRPTDSTGVSIFTALQEQLGLKLESGRGPMDVLVIDHVERPTED